MMSDTSSQSSPLLGAASRQEGGHRTPLRVRTRQDLAQLADQSLLALRPWATPGHARFDLPGPVSKAGLRASGLEGFARSFLAVGFLAAGGDSDRSNHAEWYAEGLAAGVNPAASEHWLPLDREHQNCVEAAAIAIALHESRTQIWDRLSPLVQEQTVEWLAGSSRAWYPESNWQWFHNVTQAFLRSVGGPYDQSQIDQHLDYLDSCYAGDGWYSDGVGEGRFSNIDWYSGWVMQQYALWYCRMSEGQPGIAERQAEYIERLRPYVAAATDLHGADGAPLYQGRSLAYRFASVGALWTGAVFDASPRPLGQVRHAAMNTIDYFVQRGAYGADGLLRLGWHGEFVPIREDYLSMGSTYWSSLGLAGLVLPEDHPLWTEPDVPAPIEVADQLTAHPTIGWLVSGTADDGIVRVVNHGVDHSTALAGPERAQYSRYAYSTVTAPLRSAIGSGDSAADNQVALVDADGRWSHRSLIDRISVEGNRAESVNHVRFEAPDGSFDEGSMIRTVSVVRGAVEVRAARLETPLEGAAVVLSGYPLPHSSTPTARANLVSEVVGLSSGATDGVSDHDEDSAFGSGVRVPWTRYEHPEEGRWYVAAVALGEEPSVMPRVVEDKGRVEIVWADGVVDVVA
ncbi:DUF2264 domain-containing protein [Microbacterium azadirachtae]|nr:DUF2264 domain-containing protein [Microbacterium azadirachtae]